MRNEKINYRSEWKVARILGLYLLAALGSHAGTSSPTPPITHPAPPDLDITRGVEIGKGGDKILHAEIIRAKDQIPTRGIIYVHGGGWAGGTYEDGIGRCSCIARAGYLVASIEYRLTGKAKWPAQIEDCKLGVRWLRANAAQYHIDPAHIGICGHSAGGHLVACVGTMDDPKLEGQGGYEGISSKVQAVVDMAGPVDFRYGNFSEGSEYVSSYRAGADAGLLTALFGAPFTADAEAYRNASPICHVHAHDPPFLIVHGEKDPIVSTAQAVAFADALRKAGVSVDLLIVKNGDHGLGPVPGGPAADPDINVLFARVGAFFDRNLK